MLAITPNGVGEPVGARRIRNEWPLQAGETFTVNANTVEGMVLAEDEQSLRAETANDIAERRDRKIDREVNALFSNPDPEERLIARLMLELAKDIAQLRGITGGQYRTELLQRIKA